MPRHSADGLRIQIGHLVKHLSESLVTDPRKKDMFLEGGGMLVFPKVTMKQKLNQSRRPGILVLVNDADWELEGEDKYELQPGDCILFVSTLHGG